MLPNLNRARLRVGLLAALVVALAGCTIAPPRTDDPLEHINRKVYAFNDAMDKAFIRPTAVAYRKVTSQDVRRLISNFFANLGMPVTIANDILQGNPKTAFHNASRFVVNTTVGVVGLFDPASEMNLTPEETDFGVTLAKWGVPEGPYMVLPFIGSTTVRDVWRLPVDSYFDPLWWYAQNHDLRYHAEYLPSLIYLITLRASAIDAENLLEGVYDPYVFFRDAYRQRRLYLIYNGNPPMSVLQQLEGTNDVDVDKLLDEQHAYEKKQKEKKEPEKDGTGG